MDSQCSFIKKNGEQCLAPPVIGTDLCYWHNPAQAVSRAASRKKGGVNRRVSKVSESGNYSVRSVDDISQVLEDVLNDAVALENSHARARTIGYLLQIGLKALEVGQIEERLAALEGRVSGGKV